MITVDDLCAHVLPPDDRITFQSLIVEAPRLILVATMISPHSTCPDCGQPTHRMQGHSPRTLADFPWATAPIALRFLVRRFRCCPGTCRRQTCAARLSHVAPLYARTTTRLATMPANTGLALGGAARARHVARHGFPGSRTTLLRRVRSVSLPEGPAPAVIGVDDWAWRKGQRYGTIIVDLQRGCPLDVLEDRTADTVATWLHAHPDVQIVARDRADASAAGIGQGAPEATQVADRFHLCTNVAAALQEVCSVPHRELDQRNHMPHNTPPPHDPDVVTLPPASPVPVTKAQRRIAPHRATRVVAYEQAHALHAQGGTMQAIATHLGRHHRTIKKYLQASTFPERPPRRRPPSLRDPYKAYLHERWQAGYRNAKELYHERHAQGFSGRYSNVAAYISRLRPPQGRICRRRTSGSAAPIVAVDTPLTPPHAPWLVMRCEAQVDDSEKAHLARLHAQEGEIAAAITLTQDFTALVRQRQPDQRATWLERATASGLTAFQSLANGLRADYDAVKAGVTLPWSTGPVEGQINRLKMLKRQMYGRAGIALLRRRVLHPT